MTAVLPVREMFEATPSWVPRRGRDVRAYDRRDGREVWGREHHLVSPSDLVVTNGIIRYTVGTYGDVPFLDVMARKDGIWRSIGSAYLVEPATEASTYRLVRARIQENTPDRCSVVLTVAAMGDVVVTLCRGERWLRIASGSPSSPSVARWVGWSTGPPAETYLACDIAPGAFANALDTGASGQARLRWPSTVSVDDWAVSVRWLPDAGSGAQADSGLFQLDDSVGEVSTVIYESSDQTVRWVQAGVTLTSAPQAFAAGDPLCISVGHSSVLGRTLSVDGVVVANAAATNPGTTDAVYTALVLGGVGGVLSFATWGDGAWGDGVWGGMTLTGGATAGGLLDNLMVFVGALSHAEHVALGTAVAALAGLPSPESRLVRYWPFDSPIETNGSPVSGGVAYETTADGGTTALVDDNGLLRGLAAVQPGVTKSSGLGVGLTGPQLDVALLVATLDDGDELIDQLLLTYAANRQQTRVRMP